MNKTPITQQIDDLFQPFIDYLVANYKDISKLDGNMNIVSDCIRDLESISNCANMQLKNFKLLKELILKTKEQHDAQK